MVLNENSKRKIIPVAGGKGGVGKSVIAANLALSLAMSGKKTVLADLDLGGSNLHTMLGLRNVNPGIGNLISGRRAPVSELLCQTDWENLYLIPGDVLVYGSGEPTKSVRTRITKGLLDIDADYIIVDLGGGSNFTVVDFFLISNSGLIVTTPHTTAIMNAYSFLKNYVFRFLLRAFADHKKVTSFLRKQLKERRPGERLIVSELVDSIGDMEAAAGEKAAAFLEVLQPVLIMNKISGPKDVGMAEGLRDLCAGNLSIRLECLGAVMNDKTVDRSINLQRPFIADNEELVASAEIHRISQKIIQSSHFPEMPLELDYYASSFELAQLETENDMALVQDDDENPGEVDRLLELIRIQQTKIQELQGTLRMLSMKP